MISQPGGIFEVSVIIPAHNDETRLPRAIRSVLGQSLPVSEIVVVDDGSEDRTAEVAASFPKTICLRQKNSGAAGARNAGIARARSEWIAFLDSDDEWTPDHIKNAWSLIQGQPGIAWYFCPYEKKSESGRLISVLELKNAVPSDRVIEDYFLIEAKGDSAGFTSCMIIRKRVLDEVGGFNVHIQQYGEDLDLWFRIALHHPEIGYGDKVGVTVRRREGSLTASGNADVRRFLRRIAITRASTQGLPEPRVRQSEVLIRKWAVLAIRDAVLQNDAASLEVIEREYGSLLPHRWLAATRLLRRPVTLKTVLALYAIRSKFRK